MRKYQSVLHVQSSRMRRSRVPLYMGLLLLLLLSPILYEVGMLYYAKWNTVMGTYTVARTPILDAILKAIDASRQFTRQRTTLTFLRGNWKSVYAIPFALAWALIASLVLRKAR